MIDLHCRRCNLCLTRKQVVPYRGQLPCDVLFVGEAPGAAEDVFGEPFVGPAGHLLDHIIELVEENFPFTWAITNTVMCFPKENGTSRPPTLEEKKACSVNLRKIVKAASPRLLVAVGKEAEEWLSFKIRTVPILHPAAILRLPRERRVPETRYAAARILHALTSKGNERASSTLHS